ISACVGEEAGIEYQTWEQNLDLPDPEDWIAIAINNRGEKDPFDLSGNLAIPPRSDQIMAILGALVDRVKNYELDKNGKPPEVRWLAAVDCFAEVAKTWIEPAIAAAGGLYFAVPSAATLLKAPAAFNETVLEVHKNIMAAI
ncbi:MAG: hypothetical protein ABSA77_01955, partial [Thermoguttaceae bacterium]